MGRNMRVQLIPDIVALVNFKVFGNDIENHSVNTRNKSLLVVYWLYQQNVETIHKTGIDLISQYNVSSQTHTK